MESEIPKEENQSAIRKTNFDRSIRNIMPILDINTCCYHSSLLDGIREFKPLKRSINHDCWTKLEIMNLKSSLVFFASSYSYHPPLFIPHLISQSFFQMVNCTVPWRIWTLIPFVSLEWWLGVCYLEVVQSMKFKISVSNITYYIIALFMYPHIFLKTTNFLKHFNSKPSLKNPAI